MSSATFSPSALPLGWFDEGGDPLGWFDRDFPSSPSSASSRGASITSGIVDAGTNTDTPSADLSASTFLAIANAWGTVARVFFKLSDFDAQVNAAVAAALQAGETAQSVGVRLRFCTLAGNAVPVTLNIREVTSAWSPETINANNEPTLGAVVGTVTIPVNGGVYVDSSLIAGFTTNGNRANGWCIENPTNAENADSWVNYRTFEDSSPPAVLLEIQATGSGSIAGGVAGAVSSTTATSPTGGQQHAGNIAGAVSSTAATSLVGSQSHVGNVAPAASATSLSAPAGTASVTGAVSPASAATSLSSLAGVQSHAGLVTGAASDASASSPSGTQLHLGAVSSASSGTALSTLSGASAIAGSVAPSSSATLLATPTGTQVHVGDVAPAISSTTASTPKGSQTHFGSVASTVSATVLSAPEGTAAGGVSPDSQSTASSAVGGRFSWDEYASLIREDQHLRSLEVEADEDALILTAVMVAALETA